MIPLVPGTAGELVLLVATENRHKLREFRGILRGAWSIQSLRDLTGFPGLPEETGRTFEENAVSKVVQTVHRLVKSAGAGRMLRKAKELWVLADDSGLEVDGLGGAPGVHSARFANREAPRSVNAPDEANTARLLRVLAGARGTDRSARFRCVLALADMGSFRGPADVMTFEGRLAGSIGTAPAGKDGFGYDPVFIPEGYDRSLAELGAEVKNQMSHRRRALDRLRMYFAARNGSRPGDHE